MFKCYACKNEVIMTVTIDQKGMDSVDICSDCFKKFEQMLKDRTAKEIKVQ